MPVCVCVCVCVCVLCICVFVCVCVCVRACACVLTRVTGNTEQQAALHFHIKQTLDVTAAPPLHSNTRPDKLSWQAGWLAGCLVGG